MGELIAFRPEPAPIEPRPIEPRPIEPLPIEPLWREITGQVLREVRHRREQTLAEVSARAGISVPYLSEIERGIKEPSSEVLAAVTGALGLTLADLTAAVLRRLTPLDLTAERRGGATARPRGPVALAAA